MIKFLLIVSILKLSLLLARNKKQSKTGGFAKYSLLFSLLTEKQRLFFLINFGVGHEITKISR